MKPVHMEFIANQRWRWIWSVAALGCLGLLGSAGWHWRRLEPTIFAETERINAVQLQLQELRLPVQHPVAPGHAGYARAAKLLQLDLNKAFATIENLQESEIGLRSLTLEADSNSLRLEYGLDSIVKAAAITELLNAGYPDRPWRLDSVSRAAATPPLGMVPMVTETMGFRGIWSIQLEKL
jgi:hypothetical protein